MRLREDLLRRLVKEEDGTFVQTSKWEVHPLEVVLKSEQILEILHKTTAETGLSPATTQHPETTAEGDDNEDEDITKQTEKRNEEMQQQQQRDNGSTTEHQRQSDERQGPPGDMLRFLAADGSEFRIPREVGSLLVELIARVGSLEHRVENQQRHAASSTHMRRFTSILQARNF